MCICGFVCLNLKPHEYVCVGVCVHDCMEISTCCAVCVTAFVFVCVPMCMCEGGVNTWNQSNTVIPLLSADSLSSPQREREGEQACSMLAVSWFP